MLIRRGFIEESLSQVCVCVCVGGGGGGGGALIRGGAQLNIYY